MLANDSDPNGDALTISAVGTPDVGEVTITNNTLVYTPSAQAMGDVSFSYEVTDGELSSSSTVTITNQQSVTISGIATDAPLNNGEVTATNNNGDVLATATTDSNGRYSLPILVSENPGYLVLNANGAGDQSHVSLVSRVGNFLDLRALASENDTNELSDALLLESKITHVSTALSIMYTEYVNDGGEASFDLYVAEADFEKVLGLASFMFIQDPKMLLIPMIGVGFAWASILSLPYAMLSNALPSNKMGVYMGIFNFFIVIPQLLAASILGLILRHVFSNQPIYALLIGAASFVVAAIAVMRVKNSN